LLSAQRSADHGTHAQLTAFELGTEQTGLLVADTAQLVVVVRLVGSLAVAHQIEDRHRPRVRTQGCAPAAGGPAQWPALLLRTPQDARPDGRACLSGPIHLRV